MGLTQITTGGIDDNIGIGSTSDGSTAIRILTSNTGNGEVRFGDAGNGSAGYIRYAHSGNHLIFARDGVEAMRVSSGGRLLIGTTATSVHGDRLIEIGNTSRSATYQAITTSTSGTGGIVFADTTTNDTGGYRGIIQYAHSSDSLQFSTAATERFRIDSSGRVGIGNTSMGSFTGNAGDNLVVGSGSGSEGITVYSGTTGQGAISFADGTSGDAAYRGAVEYNHTNDRLAFRTAATGNRMVIDSSGRVGIGVSAPFGKLQVKAGTNANFVHTTASNEASLEIINDAGSANVPLNVRASEYKVKIGSSEKLRIDSSGNVGIGLTSPNYKTQIFGGSDSQENILFTVQSNGVSNSGDLKTTLRLANSTSGSSVHAADISAIRSTNAEALAFSVYNGGAAPVERMRIQSDGTVKIGTGTGNPILMLNASTSGTSVIQMGDSADNNIGQIHYANSDDSMRFFANNSERMRIDSSGNLILKRGADAGNILQINGADTTSELLEAGITSGHVQFTATHASGGSNTCGFIFRTRAGSSGTSERIRFDSSGRLLAGTSSSSGNFRAVFQGNAGNNNAGGDVVLARGAATPANAQALGLVGFSDNTHTVSGAIQCNRDGGTWSSSSKPTLMAFQTCANSSSTPAERMRINSLGYMLFGQSTSNSPGYGDTTTGISMLPDGRFFSSTGGTFSQFNRNSNGSVISFARSSTGVGQISVTTTSTSYGTSSDYRLKENVVALDGAITRVKQLAPKRFNFIVDAATTVDGFLAHEAQTVVPEAVTGTHNEVDDDGNAVMQGIDQSKLVPLLTAALQEAIAKIETLETKVAVLEAA